MESIVPITTKQTSTPPSDLIITSNSNLLPTDPIFSNPIPNPSSNPSSNPIPNPSSNPIPNSSNPIPIPNSSNPIPIPIPNSSNPNPIPIPNSSNPSPIPNRIKQTSTPPSAPLMEKRDFNVPRMDSLSRSNSNLNLRRSNSSFILSNDTLKNNNEPTSNNNVNFQFGNETSVGALNSLSSANFLRALGDPNRHNQFNSVSPLVNNNSQPNTPPVRRNTFNKFTSPDDNKDDSGLALASTLLPQPDMGNSFKNKVIEICNQYHGLNSNTSSPRFFINPRGNDNLPPNSITNLTNKDPALPSGNASHLVATHLLMRNNKVNIDSVRRSESNTPKSSGMNIRVPPPFALPPSPLSINKTSILAPLVSRTNSLSERKDRLVDGRFELGKKIGKGSFGDIYIAVDLFTSERVALKRENRKSKYPQLEHEFRVYNLLAKENGTPRPIWFGSDNNFNWMAMQLLGPSLEDVFCLCNRKFSLKTVLKLADQMLYCIELLHKHNYIHRDIKPDNFLVGRVAVRPLSKLSTTCPSPPIEEIPPEPDFLTLANLNIEAKDKQFTKSISATTSPEFVVEQPETNWDRHKIFMIDFGLSKSYLDLYTNSHIPYKNHRSLTGTARYASLNVHMGCEQGRRDDVESLGYLLVYFLKGKLPWQGLKADKVSDKQNLIYEQKHLISNKTLCDGLPVEFELFMDHCRTLQFEDKPDYTYLRGLFRSAYDRLEYLHDNIYDWDLLDQEKILASSVATTDSVRNVTVATDVGFNSSCKAGAEKSNSIMTPNAESDVIADQPIQPIILPSSMAIESTNNIEALRNIR